MRLRKCLTTWGALNSTLQHLFISISSRIFYLSSFLSISYLLKIDDITGANCRYDCIWYMGIAKSGYAPLSQVQSDPKSVNWGFFPFFPELVRYLHLVIPLDLSMLSYLMDSLLFIGGTLFLGSYLNSKFGKQISLYTVIIINFSPINVYFSSGYSEASFYCFIAALVWSLHRDKIYFVLIAASLLGVSRNTGWLIAGILIFVWQLEKRLSLKRLAIAIYVSILSSVPLGLHILILREKTGDFLAVIHGHGVGRGNLFHWVINTIKFESGLQVLLLTIYIFTVYVCIRNIRTKNYFEGLLLIPVLLSSMLYPEFINWRYFLILYPVYLEVARIMFSKSTKTLFKYLIAIEAGALIFAILAWIRNLGFMV